MFSFKKKKNDYDNYEKVIKKAEKALAYNEMISKKIVSQSFSIIVNTNAMIETSKR